MSEEHNISEADSNRVSEADAGVLGRIFKIPAIRFRGARFADPGFDASEQGYQITSVTHKRSPNRAPGHKSYSRNAHMDIGMQAQPRRRHRYPRAIG